MPTPFMHLHIAEQIRHTTENGRLQAYLTDAWPAFYLGSVAPDVQTISKQRRSETHFYNVPPDPTNMAYPRMLTQHPVLADSSLISLPHALFIAAYSAHLMLDLIWLREIVFPYFVKSGHLGERPKRMLIHNILLTYLDKLALEALPDTAADTLAAAQPQTWLPFVQDQHLINWRDRIVPQLYPGATSYTVAVYAERMNMTPSEFAQNLDNPTWMETEVFSQVPVEKIQARLMAAVPESINLILEYLHL